MFILVVYKSADEIYLGFVIDIEIQGFISTIEIRSFKTSCFEAQ